MRNVCIVGYGKVAREAHRPAWQQLEAAGLAKVQRIIEPSGEGSRNARAHFPDAEVREDDASESLRTADVDLVDICSPGHTHYGLVLQALAQGQDVLVEKPLCHSLKELEAITGQARGRNLSVCQTLRLDPAVRAFEQSHRKGQLGRLTRLNVMHHARHALAESEWVTSSRPDGILFENAIHFIDLAHQMFGATDSFSLEAARFYEAGSTGVLTGFEGLASDAYGRHITIDFMQDSLRHSAIQTRVLVGGTAADGELRFYPSAFRTLSGVQDPIHELGGEIRRLSKFIGATLRPKTRVQPHLEIMQDLLDACEEVRPTLISIDSVRPTIGFLQDLSRRWGTQREDSLKQ